MNFDNNHFKDISGTHGISGFLYGMKRHYDSRYDGKGSRTYPSSTYSRQVLDKPCNKELQSQPTQRSNGFAVGGGELGSGILIGGVDFVETHPGYSYRAEHNGHAIVLKNSLTGWRRQFDNCPLSVGKPFDVAIKDALWILTGKYLPYSKG